MTTTILPSHEYHQPIPTRIPNIVSIGCAFDDTASMWMSSSTTTMMTILAVRRRHPRSPHKMWPRTWHPMIRPTPNEGNHWSRRHQCTVSSNDRRSLGMIQYRGWILTVILPRYSSRQLFYSHGCCGYCWHSVTMIAMVIT